MSNKINSIVPPIYINENKDPLEPGDITVHSTISAVTSYIEPWFVKEESYFVIDAEGKRLKLQTDGESVQVHADENAPTHQINLKEFIIHLLRNIADAKGWDYIGLSQNELSGMSLSVLVEKSKKYAQS